MKRVLGNEVAKKVLKNILVNSNFSHAYIFYGPYGIGKKTLACEWAKAILKINLFPHPDFMLVDLGEEANIPIDTIRQVKRFLSLTPSGDSKKVVIINNAENLTLEAQNAFLKIFEETPAYGILILVVEKIGLLLETIISRAIKVKFSKLSKADFLDFKVNQDYLELLDYRPSEIFNESIKENRFSNLGLLTKIISTPTELRLSLADNFVKTINLPLFLELSLSFLKICFETKLGIRHMVDPEIIRFFSQLDKSWSLVDFAERMKKIQGVYYKVVNTNFNPRFAFFELLLLL